MLIFQVICPCEGWKQPFLSWLSEIVSSKVSWNCLLRKRLMLKCDLSNKPCQNYPFSTGDNNILEAKCHVGRQTELTNGCIVGSYVDLVTPERVAENTVVFGTENNRRVQNERPPAQTLQLEFLTKVLPNYHHLRKSTKGGTTRWSDHLNFLSALNTLILWKNILLFDKYTLRL